MSAYEIALEFISADVFDENNKQKMLTFKITSLQYFANISAQIKPNNKQLDIFEIYTKGLLKNVQDGISRPLGSREIQKKKV